MGNQQNTSPSHSKTKDNRRKVVWFNGKPLELHTAITELKFQQYAKTPYGLSVIGCLHFFICRKFVVNRFLWVFENPVIPLFYGIFLIEGFHRGDFRQRVFITYHTHKIYPFPTNFSDLYHVMVTCVCHHPLVSLVTWRWFWRIWRIPLQSSHGAQVALSNL